MSLALAGCGVAYPVALVAGLAGGGGGGSSAVDQPPSVTVGVVADRQQGDIAIPYTLRDAEGDAIAVAVEFAVGSGGFQAATEAAGQGEGTSGLASDPTGGGVPHTFVWRAAEDLGGGAVAGVRIRITPSDGSSTGAPGESPPFIANNDAPTVEAAPLDAQQSGLVPLALVLTDSTADTVSLSATASVAATGQVLPITLVGTTSGLVSSTAQDGGRSVDVAWSSFDDLPRTAGLVRLRITVSDGIDQGFADADVQLLNDEAPSVFLEPVARQESPIEVAFRLLADLPAGQTRDDVRLQIRFEARTDAAAPPVVVLDNDPSTAAPPPTLLGGGPANTVGLAELEQGLIASRAGEPFTLRWDAAADLAPLFATTPIALVTLSATPSVPAGAADLVGVPRRRTFAVGRLAPALALDPGLAGSSQRGVVPIAFTLTDPTAAAAQVRFEVLEAGSASPRAMTLITLAGTFPAAGAATTLDGLVASAAGTRHVVGWNAIADLGVVTRTVTVTLTPANAATGIAVDGAPAAATFSVANNDAPAVAVVSPAAGSVVDAAGQPFVPVEIVLVDGNADPVDASLALDLGSGFREIRQSPLRGLATDAAGVRHRFGFRPALEGASSADIPGARLRVAPSDPSGAGAAAEVVFDLDQNRAPQLLVDGPVLEGQAVAIVEGTASLRVRLLDAEGDLCEAAVEVSQDVGQAFVAAPTPLVVGLDPGSPSLEIPLDTVAAGLGLAGQETAVIRLTPRDGLGLAPADRARLGTGRATIAVLEVDNFSRPAPVVTLSAPSGTIRGRVAIPYTLRDAFSYPGDVQVTVTVPGRAPFPATLGPGSEPLAGRTSSPLGVPHVFLWDTDKDFPTERLESATLTFQVTNRPPPGVTPRSGEAAAIVRVDNGLDADLVLGQPGFRVGSVDGRGFESPSAILAAAGRVVVADTNNHRVLVFNAAPASDFQAANLVLGQSDFASHAPGASADLAGLAFPSAIAFDGQRLYVGAGTGEIRIWDAFPTETAKPADRLIRVVPQNVGVAVGLSSLAVDPVAGDLYVGDAGGARVLRVPIAAIVARTAAAPGKVAVLLDADIAAVFGQPDRTSAETGGGLDRFGFVSAVAVHQASGGGTSLVVADGGLGSGGRLLVFADPATTTSDGAPASAAIDTATRPGLALIVGPPEQFTPRSLYATAAGALFVGSDFLHQVIHFPDLGSDPDFALDEAEVEATLGFALGEPTGLSGTPERLLLVDATRHRALVMTDPTGVALPTAPLVDVAQVRVIGQRDRLASLPNHQSVSPFVMSSPNAVATDRTRLFVADQGNARVLVWRTLPDSFNRAPDFVLGQPDLFTSDSEPGNLTAPNALATDGRALFVVDGLRTLVVWREPEQEGQPADHAVALPPGTALAAIAYDPASKTLAGADRSGHRVLLWHGLDPAAATLDPTPTAVVGQTSLAAKVPNAFGAADPARNLSAPSGVAIVDGKLVVSDAGNQRILIYEAIPAAGTGVTSAPAAADRVVGAPAFDAAPALGGPSRERIAGSPTALAIGAGRLFALEQDFHRVLGWNGLPETGALPDSLFGQPSFATGAPNAGGLSKHSLFLGAFGFPAAGLAVSSEHLWIADRGNNRIVRLRVLGEGGIRGDGVPTEIVGVAGDVQTGAAGVALPQPLVVEVRDAEGAPVPGVLVSFAARAGGGEVTPASALTNAQGRAQAALTLGIVAGANRVEATAVGLGVAPAVFVATGLAGPPAAIAKVAGDAQVGVAGTLLPTPLRVRVRDAFANPIAGASVAFAVLTGGGSVSQPSVPTDPSGEAATTWTLGGALGVQTVRASLPAFPGVPPVTFTATAVAPGTATRLVFVGQPPATAKTSDRFTVTVEVQDDFGNPVNVPATVTLTLEGGDPTATLGATPNPAAVFGAQAAFALVFATRPSATPYALRASVGVGLLADAVSDPFTVEAGVPAKLAIVTQPAGARAGAAFSTQPVLRALDAFDNLADPGAGLDVTAALVPATTTLQGTTTATFAAGLGGLASFADLRIDQAASFALVFTSGTLQGAASAVFSVAPADPSELVFVTSPPATITTDDALAGVVEARDAFGNAALSGTADAVTFTVDVDPVAAGGPGAVETRVVALAGAPPRAALPAGVRVRRPVAGHTISAAVTFAAGGASDAAQSSAFTVEAGRAAELVFVTAPQTVLANEEAALIVLRRDSFGNPTARDAAGAALSPLAVTISSTSATGELRLPSGAFALGPLATSFAASESSLAFRARDPRAGDHDITVAAGGSVTSAAQSFTVSPGAPARLVIVTEPDVAVAGSVFGSQPVLRVEDAFGNIADPGAGRSVTASIASGAGTLLGDATADFPPGGGVGTTAAFTDLRIDDAGTFALAFDSATPTALTQATSAPFVVTGAGGGGAPVDDSFLLLGGSLALTPPGQSLAALVMADLDRDGRDEPVVTASGTADPVMVFLARAYRNDGLGLAVPSGGLVSSPIAVDPLLSGERLVDIQVRKLNLTHPDSSELDLRLRLTAPVVADSLLADQRGAGRPGYADAQFADFGLVAASDGLAGVGPIAERARPETPLAALLLAGPAAPAFQLDVSDALGGASGGTLERWGLDLYRTLGIDVFGDPEAVVAGDLDRDGDLDLVVALPNEIDTQVRVLLTNPGGPPTLLAPISHPAAGRLALADFDRDGILDLAVGSVVVDVGSGIRVYKGDGGSFSALTAMITTPSTVRDLVAADIDSDGDADLLFAHAGSLEHITNDGAGGFSAPILLAGLSNAVVCIAVADVSRDGVPDLVVAEADGAGAVVRTLTQTAHGSGVLQFAASERVFGSPTDVAVADLDRDGRLDVVAATVGNDPPFDNGAVSVLLGDAGAIDGLAEPRQLRLDSPNPPFASANPLALAIADYGQPDGHDGDLDVFVANGDGSLSLFVNTLQPLELAYTEVPGSPVALPVGSLGDPVDVRAADLDRDGIIDLVVLHRGGLALLRGSGAGLVAGGPFGAPVFDGAGPVDLAGFVIADLDRDGVLDLAVCDRGASAARAVRFLLGDAVSGGPGTYNVAEPAGLSPLAVPAAPSAITAADLDRDGILELVTAAAGDTDVISVLRAAAADAATPPAYVVTSSADAHSLGPVAAVEVADLFADGALEVVVLEETDTGSGAGSGLLVFDTSTGGDPIDPGSYSRAPFPVGGFAGGDLGAPKRLRVVDLDRDGDLDVLVLKVAAGLPGEARDLVLLEQTAFADLTSQPALPVGEVLDVLVDDLDRNGALDIALAGPGVAGVRVIRGPSLDDVVPVIVPGVGAPARLVAGDLDRDGGPDLVVARGPDPLAGGGFDLAILRLDAPVKGVARDLVFGVPPALNQTAGAPWPGFTVEARDGFGRRSEPGSVPIAIELVSGTGALLGSTTVQTDGDGLASFDAVRYEKAETIFIRAVSGSPVTNSLTPTAPVALIVGAAAPANLRFVTAIPSSVIVREPIVEGGVRVEIVDGFGNRVSSGAGSSQSVGLSTLAGPGNLIVGGAAVDPAVAAVAGVAAFPADVAFALAGAGDAQTLRAFAAAGAPPADVIAGVSVTGAPALAFRVQPADVAVEQRLAPVEVLVRDADGVPEPGQLVAITLLDAIPGFGTLRGALAATTDAAGVARFDDLGVDEPGTFRLQASRDTDSAASQPFEVVAPLVRFVSADIADRRPGQAFDPLIAVQVDDPVTLGPKTGVVVDVSIAADHAGTAGALAGVTSVATSVTGTATFGPALALAPLVAGQGFRLVAEADADGDGSIDPLRERALGAAFDVVHAPLEPAFEAAFPAFAAAGFDGHRAQALAIGDIDRDGRNEVAIAGSRLDPSTSTVEPQLVALDFLDAVTATGLPAAIPDDDAAGVTASVAFPARTGLELLAGARVQVDITHPQTQELELTLLAPTPNSVVLASASGTGANFTGVVFDDFAPSSIADAGSPIAGRLRPKNPLAALAGRDGQGTFRLTVADLVGGSAGTLDRWALEMDQFVATEYGRGGADPGLGAGIEMTGVAFVDFSRDGQLDILAARSTTGGGAADMGILEQGVGGADGFFPQIAGSPRVAGAGAATGSRHVATGDFDRDGHGDAALVDAGGLRVHLFRGGGSNSQLDHVSSFNPSAGLDGPISAGDLDRDGILDIAAMIRDDGAGNARVVFAIGDGDSGLTFTPAAKGAGFADFDDALGVALALADMNRDGRLDVVALLEDPLGGPGRVVVGLGDGAGEIVSASRLDFVSAIPETLAVGDLDRDGRDDVLVGVRGTGTVLVLQGNGSGGFLDVTEVAIDVVASGFSASAGAEQALALGDLDQDGDLDAVACGANAGFVSVLRSPAEPFPVGFAVGAPVAVEVDSRDALLLDLDRNGTLDLVVGRTTGGSGGAIDVYGGDGVGGFGAPAQSGVLGSSPTRLAAGDVDRNGILDVVPAAPADGLARVAGGDGTGAFSVLDTVPAEAPYTVTALADLDRDGLLDLVALVADDPAFLPDPAVPALRVFRGVLDLGDGLDGNSSERFRDPQTVATVGGTQLADLADSIAVAEVTGDGILDVAIVEVGAASPRALVFRGTGNAFGSGNPIVDTPTDAVLLPSGGSPALTTTRVLFTDIDGDGLDDLVVALALPGGSGHALLTYANQRSAIDPFPSTATQTVALPARPTALVSADLDGNGTRDFAVGLEDGSVAVLLGGPQGLVEATAAGSPFPSGLLRVDGLAVGDLDRDGRPDLCATSAADNQAVFLRGGVAAAGVATSLAFGAPPVTPVTAGDVWPVFTVEVRDAAGSVVAAGVGSTAAVTIVLRRGSAAILGPLTATAVGGVASFSASAETVLRYFRAEEIEIDVVSPGLAPITGFPITVEAGPAVRLGFVAAPRRREVVDQPWPTFSVEPQDAAGNRVPGGLAGSVQLVDTGAGSFGLGAIGVVIGGGDEVAFTGVTYDAAGGMTFDVVNVGGSLAAIASVPVLITDDPTTLVMVGAPTSIEAGATWPPFTVELRDASGSSAPLPGNVLLRQTAPSPEVIASAPLDALGVARFTGVNRTLAGTVDFEAFVDPGLAGIGPFTSAESTVTIVPGPAASLVYDPAPRAAELVGAAWQSFAVRVLDAFGNTIATPALQVALEQQGGIGTLTGGGAVATVDGIATFPAVEYDVKDVVSLRPRLVGGGAAPTVPTANVSVEGLRLALASAPGATQTAGATWAPPAVLEVRDPQGALVAAPDFDVEVVRVSAGTGILSGGAPRATTAGVVTFPGLSYSAAESIALVARQAPALGALDPSPPFFVTVVGAPAAPPFRLLEQVRLHVGAGSEGAGVQAENGIAVGDIDGDGAPEALVVTQDLSQPGAALRLVDRIRVSAAGAGGGAATLHGITLAPQPDGPVPTGAVVGAAAVRIDVLDADPTNAGQDLDDLTLSLLSPASGPVVALFDPSPGDTGGAELLRGTELRDLAGQVIAGSAVADFADLYEPAELFVTPVGALRGAQADGDWTLGITRSAPTDLGRWTLELGAVASTADVKPAGATEIVTADFDADGDLDVAVLGLVSPSFDAEVSFFERGSAGALSAAPAPSHVFPGNAERLLVGDLDRSGQPDLVVIHGLNTVDLLFSQGGFDFAATPFIASASPIAPLTLAAVTQVRNAALADVDGDGLLDLVHDDAAASVIRIVPGRPDGSFEPSAARQVAVTLAGGAAPAEGLAVVDADGDGRLDLVVSRNAPGRVEVYLRAPGDGIDFALAGAGVGLPGSLGALVTGDLDRDGRVDVVVREFLFGGTTDFGLAVLLGTPSASLLDLSAHIFLTDVSAPPGPGAIVAPASALPAAPSTHLGALALADWDQDGDLDILCAANDPTGVTTECVLDVIVNQLPIAPVAGFTVVESEPSLPLSVKLPVGPEVRDQREVAVADFDGDGRLDVAVAPGPEEPGVVVLEGRAGGALEEPPFLRGPQLDVARPGVDGVVEVERFTPIGDAEVDGANPDSPVDPFGEALPVRNVAPAAGARKAYLRFDIPAGLPPAEVGLRLNVAGFDLGAAHAYQLIGLNDGLLGEAFDEATLTWNTALGNDTASGSGFDGAEATLLATFTIDATPAAGAVPVAVDEAIVISGAALRAFVDDDTNGTLSFLITETSAGGADALQVASRDRDSEPVRRLATSGGERVALATADFNRDGADDVAALLADTERVDVFLSGRRSPSYRRPLIEYAFRDPGLAIGTSPSVATNTGTLGPVANGAVVNAPGGADDPRIAASPYSIAAPPDDLRGLRLHGGSAGIADHIDLPVAVPYGQAFTIEILVRFEDAFDIGDEIFVYHHLPAGGAAAGGVQLAVDPAGEVIARVRTLPSVPVEVSVSSGARVLVPDRTAHLALVYDGREVRLFIDRQLVGREPASGPVIDPASGILARIYDRAGTDAPPARVDDVRIVSDALLSFELNGGHPVPGEAAGPGGRPFFDRVASDVAPVGGAFGALVDVAVADLDLDGRLDLAVLDSGVGSVVRLLRGDGRGRFAPFPPAIGFDDLQADSDAVAIAVGDVDGNGRADLAVVGPVGVEVFFGGASGVGATPEAFASTGGFGDVALGDIDRDGRADLVLSGDSGAGPEVRVLRRADPDVYSLVAVDALGAPGGASPAVPPRLALADLDRDGLLDIVATFRGVTAGSPKGVRVFRTRDTGVGAPQLVMTKTGPFDFVPTAHALGPVGIAIGDVDGDGDLDAILANPSVGATSATKLTLLRTQP